MRELPAPFELDMNGGFSVLALVRKGPERGRIKATVAGQVVSGGDLRAETASRRSMRKFHQGNRVLGILTGYLFPVGQFGIVIIMPPMDVL